MFFKSLATIVAIGRMCVQFPWKIFLFILWWLDHLFCYRLNPIEIRDVLDMGVGRGRGRGVTWPSPGSARLENFCENFEKSGFLGQKLDRKCNKTKNCEYFLGLTPPLLAKYGLLSQVTWDKICSLKSTSQLLGINYQLVDNLSQGLG